MRDPSHSTIKVGGGGGGGEPPTFKSRGACAPPPLPISPPLPLCDLQIGDYFVHFAA